ncbi:MAG: cytochrome b/b6 domain-containing protein [Rhodobacteraceae bacterium]|nr:cytochrome b/b6 domain-containing protein [Paracoccaceae bacterium]
MTLTNTPRRYGAVARAFHWTVALLILTAIGLGLVANGIALTDAASAARKATLFSWHKTLGITAFLLAVLRILWALTQARPVPLHPARRLETLAAEGVHWMLYVSMVAVPLTGWVHHAALDGFAPILWPFGQGLPFVPKSESVAQAAGFLHWAFTKLLIASVLLHIAGALKHALIDRDGTLSRMLTGHEAGGTAAHPRGPAFVAVALYAAALAGALVLNPAATGQAAQPPQAVAGDNWQVGQGSIAFRLRQMGAEVEGSFASWSAEITFDETPVEGRNGRVRVTIDMASVALGSVTDQATGAEFFDVGTHPTAVFEAGILPSGDGYVAEGTLTLRGVERPVTLPFTLTVEGDRATMAGEVTLDRRDFGIGAGYADEETVGFAVTVGVALVATRG